MEQQNEDFWQLDRAPVFSSPHFGSTDSFSGQQVQNQKLQLALEKRKMIEREINELSELRLSPSTPKNEVNRPPMIQINGLSMESSQDNRSPYANAPQNFGRVKTSKSLLQSYASAPQMNYPGFQAPPQAPQQQMPYFVKPPAVSPIHSYQNHGTGSSFQDSVRSPSFVQRQLSPGSLGSGSGSGSQHGMSPHVSFKFSPPTNSTFNNNNNNDRLQYNNTQGGAQVLGGQMQFQTTQGGQREQNLLQQQQQQQQHLGPYDSSPQLYNAPPPSLAMSRQNSYSFSSSHSGSQSSQPSPVTPHGYGNYSPTPGLQDGNPLSPPPMYGNVYGTAQIQVQSQNQGQGLLYGEQQHHHHLNSNQGVGMVRNTSLQRMAALNGATPSIMSPNQLQQHTLLHKQSPPTPSAGQGQNSPGGGVGGGGPNSSPIVTPQVVYQVQFKHNFRDFVPGPRAPQGLLIGQIVMVQCQRGEDLGVVVDVIPLALFVERRYLAKLNGEAEEEGTNVTHILRLASQLDLSLLGEKSRDEAVVAEIAHKVATVKYDLPMAVVDSEYQFDRQKLTIFYTSETRIDFRELVKELFATFKTRVWMKKLTEKSDEKLKKFATLSLTTGVWCDPKSNNIN